LQNSEPRPIEISSLTEILEPGNPSSLRCSRFSSVDDLEWELIDGVEEYAPRIEVVPYLMKVHWLR
jgi:hypothetical protein